MKNYKSDYQDTNSNQESQKEIFLGNFSRRSRNALVAVGVCDRVTLQKSIASGEIFSFPRLGLSGLREVVVWAWVNRS